MDATKVSPGQRIAAIAGGLLFIDMFMHWYSVNLTSQEENLLKLARTLGRDVPDTAVSAWQAYSTTDILLLIAIVIAVSGAVLAAANVNWPLPIGWAQLATLAGGLMTVLVLWRIVNQPGPNDRVNVEWGAYLGLILVAAMTYGAWRAGNEDSAPAVAPPAPAPSV
jgi:hypothetical protein